MRFLILGDSHLPDRADYLPVEIQDGINYLQKEGIFDGIFFTGDFTNQSLLRDQLDGWGQGGFLKVTRGNMDDDDSLPIFDTYAIPKTTIKIGLTHGTQIKPRGDRVAAEKFAVQNRIQILILGHSHAADVYLTPSGILILNPGSCVGAWSFIASGIPSFLLLIINDAELSVTLYEKRQTELRRIVYHFSYLGNKLLR